MLCRGFKHPFRYRSILILCRRIMTVISKIPSKEEIVDEIGLITIEIEVQESIRTREVNEHRQRALDATIKRLNARLRRLKQLLSNAASIKQIPDGASDDVLDEYRSEQPIMRGQHVYLSIARNEKVVRLPDCLLRSAVFGAGEGGEQIDQRRLGSHSNYTIWLTGYSLNAYDRRVFSACIEHYQESLSSRRKSGRGPLALGISTNDDGWVDTTFWKLGRALGDSYSPNIGRAILHSLTKLSQTRIQLSSGNISLAEMPLLDVRMDPEYAHLASSECPRAGANIAFRIVDSFAYLYVLGNAKKASTLIDKSGLAMYKQGLTSWLACYYSTHGKFFPTDLENLYRYCGATCSLGEFRRRLREALTELQSAKAPKQFRVSSFEVSKTDVVVYLERWMSKKR